MGTTKNKTNTKPQATAQATKPQATKGVIIVPRFTNLATPVLDNGSIVWATGAQDSATKYRIKKDEWNTPQARKSIEGMCVEILLERAENNLANMTARKNKAENPNDWAEGTKNDADLKGAQAVVKRITDSQKAKKYSVNTFKKGKKSINHLFVCFIMGEPIPVDMCEICGTLQALCELSEVKLVELYSTKTANLTDEQALAPTKFRQAVKEKLDPYMPEGFKLSMKLGHTEGKTAKDEVVIMDFVFGSHLPDGRYIYNLSERTKNGVKVREVQRELNMMLIRMAVQCFIERVKND